MTDEPKPEDRTSPLTTVDDFRREHAQLQRLRDSLRSEREKLEALQTANPSPETEEFERQMNARVNQQLQIRDARAQAAAEFPYADLDKIDAETGEEILKHAEWAHKAEAEHREQIIAEYEASRQGTAPPPPADPPEPILPQVLPSDNDGGPRPPSLYDVAQMSFAEKMALPRSIADAVLGEDDSAVHEMR